MSEQTPSSLRDTVDTIFNHDGPGEDQSRGHETVRHIRRSRALGNWAMVCVGVLALPGAVGAWRGFYEQPSGETYKSMISATVDMGGTFLDMSQTKTGDVGVDPTPGESEYVVEPPRGGDHPQYDDPIRRSSGGRFDGTIRL